MRHHLGVTNMVADAISHKWAEAREARHDKDGSEWSVCPDWEANSSVTNDVMQMTAMSTNEEHTRLREQFTDDLWLQEVVEALTNADMPDIRAHQRARHRALNFTIQDGKLWRIRTKAKDRVARVECVPRAKGFKLVMQTHEQNGHFGWDHTRLKLHDK